MSASATFACPFCGAPISGAHAGATFACPYCRANVVAPHAMVGGAGGGVHLHHHAPERQSGPFANGVEGVVVAFDPQLGFVAIGAHSPHGEPPRIRAWDLVQKRVLWEALQGQSWTGDLSRKSFKVIGRNVYVGHKRQLLCLDLVNGNRRWGSPLSDAVEGDDDGACPHGGLHVVDPFPLGQRGAILVRAIDNGLYAFDRDSGQPLWNRSYGDKSFTMQAVEGLGACVIVYGFPFVKADIVNPAYAQPIASLGQGDWSTDLGQCRVAGRTVFTAVDSYGSDGDEEGLLAFDAVSGQIHFFDKVDDLDDDGVIPCGMGQRVFAAVDDGAGIYVGPRGRPIPCPVPNHAVAAFCSAGPTLAMVLKKAQGTAVRRIVGIDPNTLAFRFDAGEAGTEPEGDWARQLVSDGYSLVYVAAPDDDRSRCELRSVDTTTGRTRWSRPIGFWRAHAFVGGHVVAFADETIEVLAPANGQVVASLA